MNRRRYTKDQSVQKPALKRHLRAALVRLNPGVPELAISQAMDTLLTLDAAKTGCKAHG